jgi:hypothetical protein
MQQLIAFISKFIQPNEDELNSFLRLIQGEKAAKGKVIIKAGVLCEKIFFVKKDF